MAAAELLWTASVTFFFRNASNSFHNLFTNWHQTSSKVCVGDETKSFAIVASAGGVMQVLTVLSGDNKNYDWPIFKIDAPNRLAQLEPTKFMSAEELWMWAIIGSCSQFTKEMLNYDYVECISPAHFVYHLRHSSFERTSPNLQPVRRIVRRSIFCVCVLLLKSFIFMNKLCN